MIPTTAPTKPQTANEKRLARLFRAAKAAGMPADQVRRFLAVGYIPQPKQMEFHAAAREADRPDRPNFIAMGGDRSGAKSHTIAAQVMIDDCQRYDGLSVLYLRKVGKAARESLDALRLKTFVNIPHDYARNEGVARFANGSVVRIGHFKDDRDIDNYLGIEYDIIVVEEAPQLSEKKLELLFGSLRSTKPGWRARAYLAGNPGGVGHAGFVRRFVNPHRQGKGDGVNRFIPASWRDNVFVSPEYRQYLDGLTGILRRMWRDGDWDVAGGQFFTSWSYERHVCAPFDVPKEWPVWGSFDYGFNHPTAVYLHTEHDGNIYTIAEHVQARWLPEQHAPAIAAMCERFGRHPRTVVFYAGTDAFAQRGDENAKTIASQYKERGIVLIPADNARLAGAAEILRRLGNEDAGIPPTWFIFNVCAVLIECLPNLLSDPRRPEDVLKVDADEQGEGGDDAYDSARYGLMAKWRKPVSTFAQGATRRK